MTFVEFLIMVCLVVYWLGVLVFIIAEDREPATTLLWLLFIIVLPLFGLIFYFFFGRDWRALARRHKRYAKFRALANEALPPIYKRYSGLQQKLKERYAGTFVNRIIQSIETENDVKPLPIRDITIYPSGAEKFAALKKDLASAKRFIHIQYFIWEHDKLTREITEILLDRLRDGVEVRILYDFAGSLTYKKDEMKRLGRAGADYSPDIRNLNKINYRNHRKIVIIDGDIGYTGGMNMGQEYIDGKPKYKSWRDTHIRITGQGVAELQKLFAARWYDDRRESLLDERYLPSPEEYSDDTATMIQVVAHGVEDRWESARRGLAEAGITLLENINAAVEKDGDRIFIAGLEDLWTADPDIKRASKGIKKSDFAVLVTHNPDELARSLPPSGHLWNLTLAGHPHGGQVTFFGKGLTRPTHFGQRYRTGWRTEHGVPVLVSNGVGMVTVPFRMFASPEVHVITLKKGDAGER